MNLNNAKNIINEVLDTFSNVWFKKTSVVVTADGSGNQKESWNDSNIDLPQIDREIDNADENTHFNIWMKFSDYSEEEFKDQLKTISDNLKSYNLRIVTATAHASKSKTCIRYKVVRN